MRLERLAFQLGCAALVTSAGNAHLRRTEEIRRREQSPYVRLVPDGSGGVIECAIAAPKEEDRPAIVFETGLGASFDSWDWLVQILGQDYWVVRYHRRGLGRTSSQLRPGFALSKVLADQQVPAVPLHLVGHSLGGLVIANSLAECPSLAERVHSATLIDATDGELLAAERGDRSKVRQFRQYCLQEGLAALTGMGRWTGSPVETEVNFRATTQRAFLTESSRPRTLLTAVREHADEPAIGQRHLARMQISKTVIAAADNVMQQQVLADRLGADFEVVPDSSHRSVIGRYGPALVVANIIRRIAG